MSDTNAAFMSKTNPVLTRFYEATNLSSIADLADFLDIRRQAVYSALKSGKFPNDWYFRVAKMTNYSIDWLINGVGPKKRLNPDNISSASDLPQVIDTMCECLVGSSANVYDIHRCKIRLCQNLLSQKEDLKNPSNDEKKNSRINNIKEFASKVAA